MKNSFALSLLSTFLFAYGASGEEKKLDDKERLQGAWGQVRLEIDGKPVPEATAKAEGFRLIFKADTVTLEGIGYSVSGTFKLDAAKSPKTIDFDLKKEDGTSAGITPSIYDWDGDALRICLGRRGEMRPTEFKTTLKSKLQLLGLKKVDDVVAMLKAEKCNTFLKALEAAGLLDTLKGKGPYTVFAPPDKAFESLPKGMFEDLLKPENKAKLAELLKRHILPIHATTEKFEEWTKPAPGDLVKVTSVNTLSNDKLWFSSKTAVDRVKILQSDVCASNGFVHVVEEVLIPKKD